VVVVVPRVIRSPRLQPHLRSNAGRLVGAVWSLRISSSCGDLWIVKELHRQFFLLLRLWDGCGLLDPFGEFPSTTYYARLTQGGAAAVARRRYRLEVEDEEFLKDLVVILFFMECFILFIVSFNASVLLLKKKLYSRLHKNGKI
jgi:hypothetical protein